ncbi:MAG: guanosine monophosphate reductase [Bdellovibrionales bacterium]
MGAFLTRHDIADRPEGLTFDDVLVVPCKSEVKSRKDPDLSSQITKKITRETPIISSNMDTVTEGDMAKAMSDLGGVGILHRFIDVEQQIQELELVKKSKSPLLAASVGIGDKGKERAKALFDAGVELITIDIAHGHSSTMMDLTSWIKKEFPSLEVIAGNVATPEAVKDLANAGADAIKVGIGPGSMCTTRIITGCGLPQLTAIAMCKLEAEKHNVPIIADGGIKTSGDIFKAFCAGADSVMLGSLLAGTLESPGEVRHGKKLYRGMASRSAQDSWRGGVAKGMAPEGESHMINIKGHVESVVMELTGGVRSGMSYINAIQFSDIKDNARFIKMSTSGIRESVAHGLSL